MAKKTFFERHAEAIKGGLYPEGLINGFRKAYHAADRRQRGYSTGLSSANVTWGECKQLFALVEKHRPRVEEKQKQKGIDYLNKWRRKLGTRELSVLDAISYFELIDYRDLSNNDLAFIVPVYRAVAKDGSSFSYCAQSWQSGGKGPDITG